MRIIEVTELETLQQKADNLEALYYKLGEELTPESSTTDFAVRDIIFQQFEETYDKIHALRAKEARLRKLDPRTWFSKK